MRKTRLFWAVVLILVGLLLLVDNLGLLAPLFESLGVPGLSVWSLVGPLVLIALGVWFLWGTFFGRSSGEAQERSIPLQGAARAHVRIRHGAGRLRAGSGAGAGQVLSGTFAGGVDEQTRREGDTVNVELGIPPDSFLRFAAPWSWGARGAYDWSLGLNEEIPLSLELETGASETQLDLSALQVTELCLQTGASSTEVTLPAAAGQTRVRIASGVASVRVRVPPDVAARIRVEGGLANVSVDRSRFPRQDDVYRSAGYDEAANRIDMEVETGMGSVEIR